MKQLVEDRLLDVQGESSLVAEDVYRPIAQPSNWHNTPDVWNASSSWVPGDDDAHRPWKRGDGFINYVRYVLLGHTRR